MDHANKKFLNRSFLMKLQFPTRKRRKITFFKRVNIHMINFIYHLKLGKNPLQAWDVAKRTF
jgi:hypothetical protein